jgi:hypothetical protein
MTFAPSGVDAMCVGGNSRSDAIRVKGMIACNYRRMPIRGPFGDRCGKHGPPRPIVSMVTLQVRNEHKVFGNVPDDGSQERQNLIVIWIWWHICTVM